MCISNKKILKFLWLFCICLQRKDRDSIDIDIRDLQPSSAPLIFQETFEDPGLHIGDNALSQNWRQKRFSSLTYSGNEFRLASLYEFRN